MLEKSRQALGEPGAPVTALPLPAPAGRQQGATASTSVQLFGWFASQWPGAELTRRPALPPGERGPRCSPAGRLHLEPCKPPLGPAGSKGKSGSELRAGWDRKRHQNAAKVCSTPPQLRLYAPQTPGTHQTIRSAAPAEALPYTKSPPGRQGGSPPGVAGATVGRGAPSAAPRGAAAGRPASH